MAETIIDLSNFRDRSGSRVPEGDYLVAVDDLEIGETRKGDPMWTVYLKIIGGEHDGLNLIDRLTLSEKAMFRVVGFLQGLGVKTPRKRLKLDTNRFLGKKVMVQVADGEPYNGTIRSEIKAYQRYAAPAAATPDLDDLADEEEVESPETAAEAPAETPAPKESPKEETTSESPVEDTNDDAELDLDELDI